MRAEQTWDPGDFAVVHSRALVGAVIDVMQRWSRVTDPELTGWVHAITGLPDGMIGEAEPGGYRVVPMHYSPADVFWSTGRLAGPPTLRQRNVIVAEAKRMEAAHVGYSFLDYAAIAAHQWHVWAPGLRSYIAATGHEMCSAAVDWQHQVAAYPLFTDRRWDGYVRPYDLALLIDAPDPDSFAAQLPD
jgi:hypothetical protein